MMSQSSVLDQLWTWGLNSAVGRVLGKVELRDAGAGVASAQ